MAKKDIDKKVGEALRALNADKEASIRALVIALDGVGDLDSKLVALNARRSAAVAAVESRHQEARGAGWKAKELADAGLNVPRVLDLAALGADSGNDDMARESDQESHSIEQ